MNTKNSPHSGQVHFSFSFNKLPDAKFPYVLQVVQHTHAILRAIALIELLQPVRSQLHTLAVPGAALNELLAVLDDASGTGDRFEMDLTEEPDNSLLVPDICQAQATVHSQERSGSFSSQRPVPIYRVSCCIFITIFLLK